MVSIKETKDRELLIYNSETGELLAKHQIPDGKGQLIKDRKHTRDRSKGIDTFIDTVAKRFEETETAYDYLDKLREKYPRYIRDQLQMILKETKQNNEQLLTAALSECIKRNLYSATDFSDIILYLKRQRQVHDTTNDKAETVSPLNSISGWIIETEAQKRNVDAYTVLLEEGDQS